MHYFFSWTKFLLWLFIIEYFDIIWHLTFQNIFFSQNQKHFNECFIFFFNRSQGHTLKGLGQFLKENEQCGIAVWLLAHLSFSDHHLSDFKHLFSQNTTQISTKLGTKQPWVKRIQVCLNEGPPIFQRRDNNKIAKIHSKFKKSSSPEPKGQC